MDKTNAKVCLRPQEPAVSLITAWISLSLSAGAHLTLSHHVLLSPSWQSISAPICTDFWQVWEGNRHSAIFRFLTSGVW